MRFSPGIQSPVARFRAFDTSLAVAVALHIGLLAWLAREPRDAPHAAPSRQAQEIEVGVLLDEAPARPTRTAAPEPGRGGPARARVVMVGRLPRARTAEPAAADVETSALEEPAPAATAPDSAPTAPAARPGLDQLGIGMRNPLLRGPADLSSHPRAGNVAPGIARSLAEGVAQREAQIGLGPEGPVIRTLEAVATRAPGPMNGHALFAATVDSSGKLLGINVVSASEQFGAWEAMARRTAAALSRKKLRKPAGGRAVRLVIAVDAREQMPSGADPGVAVDVMGIPVKKGKGKRSARISILPLPKGEMAHVQTPDGIYDIPWVTMPIPGVALAGDLSDIGATSRRMVHAHLVSTSVL